MKFEKFIEALVLGHVDEAIELADEAISELKAKVQADPSDAASAVNLANMYAQLGREAEASQIYEELLKRDPDNCMLLVSIGYQNLRTDKNRAFDALTRVIRLSQVIEVDPTILSLAHTNLGVFFEEKAYFENAVAQYAKAIAIDPSNQLAPKYLDYLEDAGENGIPRTIVSPDGTKRLKLWHYLPAFRHGVGVLPLQDILIPSAIIEMKSAASEGQLIRALAIPWMEILTQLERNPAFLFEVPWRKLEEIIAAAYDKAGWSEVILTPRSGDGGRDVIASKPGVGGIRIFDQVKAYAPGNRVSANDVRALLGVLNVHPNVSKGVITTTSTFAPGVYDEFERFAPYRLELRDGELLKKWLLSIDDDAHIGNMGALIRDKEIVTDV